VHVVENTSCDAIEILLFFLIEIIARQYRAACKLGKLWGTSWEQLHCLPDCCLLSMWIRKVL